MSSIQSNISNYSNPTAPGKANLIILIGLIQDLDVFDLVHTFQAPQANSFAEHWVRSVREECLDHILIVNQNHLRRVSKEYINYYNHHRPHQVINQQFPISGPKHNRNGPIQRRNILGGIIHDYYRQPFSST